MCIIEVVVGVLLLVNLIRFTFHVTFPMIAILYSVADLFRRTRGLYVDRLRTGSGYLLRMGSVTLSRLSVGQHLYHQSNDGGYNDPIRCVMSESFLKRNPRV